jgi:hypothetical protein
MADIPGLCIACPYHKSVGNGKFSFCKKSPSTNGHLHVTLDLLQPETSGGMDGRMWARTGRNQPMSLEAHIETLEKKHGDLEAELHTAMLHPSTGDTQIAEIKRQKLKIKDEIERLRVATRH